MRYKAQGTSPVPACVGMRSAPYAFFASVMKLVCRALLLLGCPPLAAVAQADTLIFKDGTFVDGEITLETRRTVHVKTRFGARTYRRSDIEEVIESVESLDPQTVNRFTELPDPVRAVLNARAEYDLKQYEKALARLEPPRDLEQSRAIEILADWLVIEINERLGRWETAKELLEEKKENGTPQEKIRAEAHLALFDLNPGFNLVYVGEKNARKFIAGQSLLARAKEPGALRDHEIMRLALEEFCEQLLVEDELGVKKFGSKLDADVTYRALKEMPGGGDVAKRLPYVEDLKAAEATIAKARAILGEYGSAFEMDVARTELYHLWEVLNRLLEDAVALSPETLTPGFDQRTGQLTKQGRNQWRQRCDEFLAAAQPIAGLLEYMLERIEYYPHGLRTLRKVLTEFEGRFGHMVKAVKKVRNRTRV